MSKDTDLRLYLALKHIEQQEHRSDYLWENPHTLTNVNEVMCDIYINMLRRVLPLVKPYFDHYSFGRDPQRFKNLHSVLHYSVASSHDMYCGVQFYKTVKDVNPIQASTYLHSQNKTMVQIMMRASSYRSADSLFFPAPPKLMVGRMANCFAHEYGHVLNQYNQDVFLTSPKSLCRYIHWVTFATILLSSIFTSIPDRLFKQHPYLIVGSSLGGLSVLGSLLIVQTIRHHKKHNEYKADKTSLHLMPPELHYGPIVFYTESLCVEHHERLGARHSMAYSLYSRTKRFFKKLIFPSYAIHPSSKSRMSRAVHDILALRKPHERVDYLKVLQETADETLENYKLQHGNTVVVEQSVRRARKDVNYVWRVNKNLLDI